jgi:hypothetical protein
MTVRQYAIITISLLLSAPAPAAARTRPLLSDGSFLARAEGRLIASEPNEMLEANQDRWFFEFSSTVTDGRTSLRAGTVLELLPSAALEEMIDDSAAVGKAGYLLWASVTKYNGRNYLFAHRSTPVIQQRTEPQKKPLPPDSAQEKSHDKPEPEKTGPAVTDQNDVLKLPPGIAEILKTTSSIRPRRPQLPDTEKAAKGTATQNRPKYVSDRLLPNRMGSIGRCDKKVSGTDRCFGFEFDSYGRTIDPGHFILLPCQALELAETEKSLAIKPPRFRAAGIVTTYRSDQYLLLQRITRVYSYQNLGR